MNRYLMFYRLELFYVLSADGKDLSQFELEAGKLYITLPVVFIKGVGLKRH